MSEPTTEQQGAVDAVDEILAEQPTRLPVNGRDVGWAVADGETRPIREVLAERKTKHNEQHKGVREAAFRERAWRQALLLSCLCCYPLQLADTRSKHEEWCPAHGMWLSHEAQKKIDRERHGVDKWQAKPDDEEADRIVDFGVNPTREMLEAAGFSYDSEEYRRAVAAFDGPFASASGVVSVPGREVFVDVAPQTPEQREARELGPITATFGVDQSAEAVAARGDRGEIAKALLACDMKSPDRAVLLKALAKP